MRRLIAAALLIAAASPAAAQTIAERARAAYLADDFAAAADLYAAAPDAAPDYYGAALIRLNRPAEARALLTGPDPVETALNTARALRLAGRTGAARNVLAGALAAAPHHPALAAESAETELAAGRLRQAVAPALLAGEKAPADPRIVALQMRVLMMSAMPVRARKAALDGRAAGMKDTRAVALLEIDSLQAVGDHAGAVDAAEDFIKQNGEDHAIMRRTLPSLSAIGADVKRLTWLDKIGKTAAPAPLSKSAVLARRFQTQADAGEWDQAALTAAQWAALRPFSIDAAAALCRDQIAERLGWGRVFAHAADLVEADPLSPDRRLFAAQIHAGLGGSRILALAHLHALDDLVPADDPRALTGRALRDDVLRGLTEMGKIEELQINRLHVKLIPPAGGYFDVAAHPRTGRLLHFETEDHRLTAEWSDDGAYLQRLTDSNGSRIDLVWKDGALTSLRGRDFAGEIRDGQPRMLYGNAVSFNAALAAATAWNRADLAAARWLRL